MAMGTAGECNTGKICYLDDVINATHRMYHGHEQLSEVEEAFYQNFGVRPGTSLLHTEKHTDSFTLEVCAILSAIQFRDQERSLW